LHDGGDHVDWGRYLYAFVYSGQQERLRASAGSARCRQPGPVHFGQGLQEVQSPHRVPQLQAQRAERPELLFGRLAELVLGLGGVVVAHHVIGEGHVTLGGQIGAQPRNGIGVQVLETAMFPVPVRNQDAGKRAALAARQVEVPRQIVTGQGLNQNFLHGPALAFDASGAARLQRNARRQRPEACGSENLLAQLDSSRLPLVQAPVSGHPEVRFGVRDILVTQIAPRDGAQQQEGHDSRNRIHSPYLGRWRPEG
jgi:hypothetical protein